MPLYEYQCARCGRFEIIRKFSDSPLLTCPTCGGEIQKLLSAPAIQFKGTGWYITDYARKSTGGEAAGKGGEGGLTASGSKDGGSSKDGASSKEGASSSQEAGAGAPKAGTSDGGSTPKGSAGGSGAAT